MMSVIGPEYWFAKQMAASCRTISIICSAELTVPPSIAAKVLTHPSATLVAVGNGVPSLSTISGIGCRYWGYLFPLGAHSERLELFPPVYRTFGCLVCEMTEILLESFLEILALNPLVTS